MKKIVGILTAAALATSVFAVDFSAGFQLKGSLFNYDGASEEISAFTLRHDNTKDDKPFIFTLSDDRVGATIKIYDANVTTIDKAKAESLAKDLADWIAKNPTATQDEQDAKQAELEKAVYSDGAFMAAAEWNIWFKPFDSVKVELGKVDTKLNCETITYWKGKTLGGGEWGYKATFESNGLAAGVAFVPGNDTPWFKKPKSGDAVLNETDIFASYTADFGTISALFIGKDTFKDIAVGAGYKNTFNDLTIFADAAFLSKKENKDADAVNGIKFDVDAKYAKDDFGFEAYAQAYLKDLKNVKKEQMELIAMAKGTYAINGGTAYLKFRDDNLLADPADVEFIELGYDGSIGSMSYEIGAQVQLKKEKVNFGIPFYFRFGF